MKQEADVKFYNQKINDETMTLKTTEDRYVDPIVKERKEKERFKKKILLQRQSYRKQVNNTEKAKGSVANSVRIVKAEKSRSKSPKDII